MKVGNIVRVSEECTVLRFKGAYGIVVELKPRVARVLLPTELHLISCDKLEVISESR